MSELHDMPVCDLRNISSVEEAKAITSIHDVALIILPKDIPAEVNAALLAIEKKNIAATISLSADAKVNMINGVHEVRENDFDASGETLLMINGVCIIHRLSPEVKGKMIVNGVVLLHDQFQEGCPIEFLMFNGINKYADFDQVKVFPNTLEVTGEFLEYIPPKTVLTIGTEAVFDDTVTVDMLRSKEPLFIVGSKITCPKKLEAYLKATAIYGEKVEVAGSADE